MPRRQFIDRKNATTYALVHRAQDDPLINDSDAPQVAFTEIRGPSAHHTTASHSSRSTSKAHVLSDLESRYAGRFRENEGQAAEHGIFYDDTSYDYMQHMRDLGAGEGASTWIEASSEDSSNKGKQQKLEDMLQDLHMNGDNQSVSVASSKASLLPDDAFGSAFVMKRTYQDQQDIPDAIGGFLPDMDPRLREVLQALDDDAYVDDQDDIFDELGQDEVVDEHEFEDLWYDDENDEGWESDATVKADVDLKTPVASSEPLPPPTDPGAAPPEDTTEGAWMAEFKKFKKTNKPPPAALAGDVQSQVAPSTAASGLTGLSSLGGGGRRKKRKGALTSTSNYSMTSSALARTDQLTTLDARFDRLLESYENDDLDTLSEIPEDDGASMVSGVSHVSRASRMSRMSRMSKASNTSGMSRVSGVSSYSRASDAEAPSLVPKNFDEVMDGFLANHSTVGRFGRMSVRKVGRTNPLDELDQIRSELGPARVKSKANA